MTKRISEQELIRQFEEIARFELPQTVVDRDIKRVRKALTEDKGVVGVTPLGPWRHLATNRWAKYLCAAAACLVLALAVHHSATRSSAPPNC